MASLNKQLKRAKRAKAKAKHIRMVGRKPLDQDDNLGHLDEPIPEYTLADMENAENEGMAATHLAADMLIDYRMWADGMDIETAQAWLTEPQFITDFGIALDTYGKSLEDSAPKAE